MDSPVELGIAQQVLEGQVKSGDRYLYKEVPNGVFIAVLDGLGHGEEASEAAEVAVRVLEAHAQESVISLFKQCHDALRDTRGVVMSVALLNLKDRLMTWAGVGNVEGRLLRADPQAKPRLEYLLLRSGVVGNQLPMLQAAIVPVFPGDTLALVTDGVQAPFFQAINAAEPPQKIADTIISRHHKAGDDALVLVARLFKNKA